MHNIIEDYEKQKKVEKFTFTNALDVAWEWIWENTRIGWLLLIGIFLVVAEVMGWWGSGDVPWINVLWPLLVAVGTIFTVAAVFYVKYDYKVVIEEEVEAKEWAEKLIEGRKWNKSVIEKVILEVRWMKKK